MDWREIARAVPEGGPGHATATESLRTFDTPGFTNKLTPHSAGGRAS